MNRITISWIFLIVISMFLPTSAIMYTSGQSTDNSDGSSPGGSTTTDNSGSSTTPDNSGSSSTGGGTTTSDNSGSSTIPDNSGSSSTGGGTTSTPTSNNTTLPTTSTVSNNTGNESADLVNNILDMHNRERAAVGSPPLVWNDTLAADAKTWANHLATTGQFVHDPNRHTTMKCSMTPSGGECIKIGVGENIAPFLLTTGISATGQGQSLWVDEKKDYHGECCPYGTTPPVVGHYTQMVWNTTTSVGCGTASADGQSGILVCKYYPWGNLPGHTPY